MDHKKDKDVEIIVRLGNYMHFMKGYGQLTRDIAKYTKSSPEPFIDGLRLKPCPARIN